MLENVLGKLDSEALRKRANSFIPSFNLLPPGYDTNMNNLIGTVNPIAVLCFLRGKVYEILENRSRASLWYEVALFCDVYCFEAFDALVDGQLPPSKEKNLIDKLDSLGAFDDDEKWLKLVYECRLNKNNFLINTEEQFEKLSTIVADEKSLPTHANNTVLNHLGNDLDCAVDKAESLYQLHDSQRSYSLTRHIRLKDPYHLRCIPVHLASLVELKYKSELFYTAHLLIESYPNNHLSWFAVGCYYYCIGRYDAAGRFFLKATSCNSSFTEAWVALGHAFAAQDESDQAMAAYRTASRLFVGCHIPVLYTAKEYLRTNNVALAGQFCRQANIMCPTDPFVMNELGIVYYRQQRYHDAQKYFLKAIHSFHSQPKRLQYASEPVMFNLGHTHRKLGDYDLAIRYYVSALEYNPKEASIYAALALTYHLKGCIEEAIENYHNALGLKPEDMFSSEMLEKVLEEYHSRQISDDVELNVGHLS